MVDAIVIGGGIIGSSVAYHLEREGLETVLLDRNDAGRATEAGAGIISPATSSRSASDEWFAFGNEAAAYYPGFVERIERATEMDTGFDRCGLYAVAVDDEELEPFEAMVDRIEQRRATAEHVDTLEGGEVLPEEASERFPGLAQVERAYHLKAAGRVEGARITGVILRAATDRGVTVRREAARHIRIENGRVTGVDTDGSWYEAERVVVAGGAWSGAFAEQLGIDLPVEPQRGQIVHVRPGRGNPGGEQWPVIKAFRGHYIVPWPDGRVVAGATREDGSGFDNRLTVAGVVEVLEELQRVAPGLASAELIDQRVGLRPASVDGLPIIGRVPDIDGAYLATGHGPTGLQLGPYTGKVLATIVEGRDPEVELSPFEPGRFA